MPLIAADANRLGRDIVACSSTAWPICETINCQIICNNDQLEMELLPCWQHPAMWFKNRDLKGNILYQDIFDASRVATANIGGENVTLNVTVVQRGITLGFGVSARMKKDCRSPNNQLVLNVLYTRGVLLHWHMPSRTCAFGYTHNYYNTCFVLKNKEQQVCLVCCYGEKNRKHPCLMAR